MSRTSPTGGNILILLQKISIRQERSIVSNQGALVRSIRTSESCATRIVTVSSFESRYRPFYCAVFAIGVYNRELKNDLKAA